MNSGITAAVLHVREAARLLQTLHPDVSDALFRCADVLVDSSEAAEDVAKMDAAAGRISEGAGGQAG